MEKQPRSPPLSTPPHKLSPTSHHASTIEHTTSFRTALRLYPSSIGWSAFFSMGVIMTAFDPQLLGSLFATPSFQKDFGYWFEDGEGGGRYIVSAPWQTGLGMGNPIGQVLGALAAGYPMEWWGRKLVSSFFVTEIHFSLLPHL